MACELGSLFCGYLLTRFRRLIFVTLLDASPECRTNRAMRRQYASNVLKHLARASVGLLGWKRKMEKRLLFHLQLSRITLGSSVVTHYSHDPQTILCLSLSLLKLLLILVGATVVRTLVTVECATGTLFLCWNFFWPPNQKTEEKGFICFIIAVTQYIRFLPNFAQSPRKVPKFYYC